MIDEFADERGGHRTIEDQRVPMLLVHVITRSDRTVGVPQRERALRIALQVDRCGKSSGAVSANIFPATL